MSLQPGTHLGPYSILSQLGAGGMGEVYKARDTRLGRLVAIKVLPEHLANNPDLNQRFQREARAISRLNHPNICVLHDIGHQDGTDYLVMEYLEGETLAQRLTKGALPADAVLPYAIQIADGLDKAHRQGIIHCDLKPGNIMLTGSGAKLLDFGLAKLRATDPATVSTSVPTEKASLTPEGMILGTFQYMAPEQLEGKEVDARTDIFAFGAVLYEMVTGRKAFEGKTRASLISSIMSFDPRPVSSLQPMTAPALDHVVKRCLTKAPEERWQSTHDLMNELRWIAEAGSQAGIPASVGARRRGKERWLMAAALAVGLIGSLGVLAWVAGYFSEPPVEVGVARFTVHPPDGWVIAPGRFSPHLAVSPDGRKLAFVAVHMRAAPRSEFEFGSGSLWVRTLDSLSPQRLARTEGARLPFWSPDGEFIGFFADGKLKKIPVFAGSPQTLCEAPAGEGATWSRQGVIVFAPTAEGGLCKVSAAGGVAVPVTQLNAARQESAHVWPQFLPDARRFIFLVRSPQRGWRSLAPTSKRVSGISGLWSWPVAFPRDLLLVEEMMPSGRRTEAGWPLGTRLKVQSACFRRLWGGRDAEVLFQSEEYKYPEDWSKDGRFVLYISPDGKAVYTVPVSGDRKPTRVWESPFDKDEFHLSPDGRWIAYNSIESGRWEVYVASFPEFRNRRQVSKDGGCQAWWRKDGKELFYLGLDGRLMAVDVSVGNLLETGVPRALFQTAIQPAPVRDQYCVTGDGQRFLLLEDVQRNADSLILVLNWTAALVK